MERILLYYPTIEFPKENWLRQALLYSDKVSSILPYKDESEYPESIKYLNWKGEYSPIFIDDLIRNNSHEYESFADKFLCKIDNNTKVFYASSKSIHPNIVNSLFSNKLSERIIYELEHRNLIRQKSDRRIYIPENIAIYYMSVLAKFVSSVVEEDLIIPSTDYKRFSELSFENGIESEKAMNLIFKNCLPVPDDNVELSDIIDFKNNHKQDLLKFRLFYTKTQDSLKNCRDSIDLKEGLLAIKERIDLELMELEKLYSKNKIRVVYSSLNSLFGIENPKLFSSLLSAGVISTAIDPIIGLGVGVILVAGKLIDNIVSKPNKANEFNYLFEARKEGIIQ